MKVHICNLGPVKETDLEIKPFTVFIGPNNSGKSWTAYALAGILSIEGRLRYEAAEYTRKELSETYPTLHKAVQQALDEGEAKFDIVQFADAYAEKFFNELFEYGKYWLGDILGTKQFSFDKFEAYFQLGNTKPKFLEKLKATKIDERILLNSIIKNPEIKKDTSNPLANFIVGEDIRNQYADSPNHLSWVLMSHVLGILQKTLYSDVHILPTERVGVLENIITPQGDIVDITEPLLTKKSLHRNGKIDRFPLRNFGSIILESKSGAVDSTYTITNSRMRKTKKSPEIQNFLKLAELLEKELLGGSVDYYQTEDNKRGELLFEFSKDKRLEIQAAPAIVKELAALVLYLRYVAEPDELLVIDEPEMNLHPEAQAKLTELLAMLVNSGIQVLVTTHSPYLVDHLANLVKAAASSKERQREIKEEFYLKNENAFIEQSEVASYLFDNGVVRNVLEEQGFVNWQTFSQVSDKINTLFFDI